MNRPTIAPPQYRLNIFPARRVTSNTSGRCRKLVMVLPIDTFRTDVEEYRRRTKYHHRERSA